MAESRWSGLATGGKPDTEGDSMKKKRSVREKIEDVLAILLGRWGRYPEDDDEDIDEWEDNPRYKKGWRIGLSDEDVKPK